MAALRSRRLETLLGAPIADATYRDIASLVAGGVAESFDLDFKRELYGNSDGSKRALGVDIAALANAAGGLIVVGIAEDNQARATQVCDVAVGDDEVNRMFQITAAVVAPLPAAEIRAVENPVNPGTGFLLISVPRSLSGPHAVLVNNALRFPRRHGTTTAYLSEPEVAQAYRDRFAGLQSRLDAAADHEAYLIDRLDTAELTYLVVSLVPDLDGYVEIDSKCFDTFQGSVLGQPVLSFHDARRWQRARVGAARLLADAARRDDARSKWCACSLHSTGAGAFAAAAARHEVDGSTADITDEMIVDVIMSGLRFLASHARDRAAAGGTASLRATLAPVTEQTPARLIHKRHFGFSDVLGRTTATVPPAASAVADVEDLADSGPSLLVAARTLSTGLIQQFGHPEVLQVTRDGTFRTKYWSAETHAALRSWAERNGVGITDETVG